MYVLNCAMNEGFFFVCALHGELTLYRELTLTSNVAS